MIELWWWVGVGVAAVVVGFVLLWWWMPKWQMRAITAPDPKDRADIEDNFRKTIGQALGGVAAAFIAAGFTYMQFSQQQQATAAQRASALEQLSGDQIAKGFSLLGNENILLRLGGIYTLELVMNRSSLYSRSVLETLCAFVRSGTIAFIITNEPTPDIQATLTVIARRNRRSEGRVDLRAARIPGADLSDADLSKANLTIANLSGTLLSGADLTGANLTSADLRGANMDNAILSNANLSDADLSGAGLSDAVLTRAYLSGANLTNSDLTRADLSGADLSGSNLSNADLKGANLSNADLKGANLSGANLSYADVSGSKVSQTQLDQACGVDATLPDPNMTLKPCPNRESVR